MTTQTAKLVSLLEKIEALHNEVAKLVATEKASTTPRREVIAQAKEYVEIVERQRARNHYTAIEFHINERKGTVVALRKSLSGSVLHVGRATVSRDDKFDAHIGKAIALKRAMGEDVPKEFLNAPQK